MNNLFKFIFIIIVCTFIYTIALTIERYKKTVYNNVENDSLPCYITDSTCIDSEFDTTNVDSYNNVCND